MCALSQVFPRVYRRVCLCDVAREPEANAQISRSCFVAFAMPPVNPDLDLPYITMWTPVQILARAASPIEMDYLSWEDVMACFCEERVVGKAVDHGRLFRRSAERN